MRFFNLFVPSSPWFSRTVCVIYKFPTYYTDFYWVLPSLPSFNELNRVFLSSTSLYLVFLENNVLLCVICKLPKDLAVFYWVYLVLPSFFIVLLGLRVFNFLVNSFP